ncbi:MAG: hypothetical protein RLZZ127_356 [Planctomycetota bacterium]|jgi:outer membrane protein assembly factor BamB
MLALLFAAAATAGEPAPPSGLCVVVPAVDAGDLIARAAGGRVLVHALATDAAAIPALREAIARAGMSGLVTVAAWDQAPALPYAENLVDALIVDADALGARAPAAAEIDRVLVPRFGRAQVRTGGVWKDRTAPMPARFGEWTHYFHDATNNPVGSDAIGVSTSLRWIAESQSSGTGYQLVGGGRLVSVSTGRRSNFSGYGGIRRWTLRVRNAFNGIPQWEQTGDPKKTSWQRYEAAIIDGDRIIQLRAANGPLVARSLVDGRELQVFDQVPVVQASKVVAIAATTDKEIGADIMAILEGRILYAASGNLLSAVDADSGRLLWRFTGPEGTYVGFPCFDRRTGTLAIAIGPLGVGSARMTHFRAVEFRGFDAATGDPRWTTHNPITDYIASMATLDGTVCVATAGHLGSDLLSVIALDAATGSVRWTMLDRNQPGAGTLLLYPGRAYVGRGHLFALDLADGRVLGSYQTGNARCDVPRGSSTTINNFGHFFDVSDPARTTWRRREVVRNSCGGAAIPAYGLRFASDNRCSCFEAIRGHVALGPERSLVPTPDAQRLLRGPAHGRPLASDIPGWTAFLGDDRRSGVGGGLASGKPVQTWRVRLATAPAAGPIPDDWRRGDQWNGPITPPTVADGRVYVAETSGQRLVCLDAATGRELWSFRSEGRIDGPPRIVRGRAVFGAHDGHVYCLDARDGALAWRFQAAPARRLVAAYSQLESAWPLRGALPVVGDTVLASAGWHPEADGGIALWGLDLATGAIRWQRTIDTRRPELALPLDGQDRKIDIKAIFEPNRVLNTVMVADRDVVQLMGLRLAVADGKDAAADHPGFALMPRWGTLSAPYRRPSQLDLDGPGGWGAQWTLTGSKLMRWRDGKPVGKPGLGGRPICLAGERIVLQGYASENGGVGELSCFARSAASDGSAPLWSIKAPHAGAGINKAASSMILAGNRVVSAVSVFNATDWQAVSGHLEIRNLADGALLHALPLDVPTVDHGLASADGRLFLSLDNGELACWE